MVSRWTHRRFIAVHYEKRRMNRCATNSAPNGKNIRKNKTRRYLSCLFPSHHCCNGDVRDESARMITGVAGSLSYRRVSLVSSTEPFRFARRKRRLPSPPARDRSKFAHPFLVSPKPTINLPSRSRFEFVLDGFNQFLHRWSHREAQHRVALRFDDACRLVNQFKTDRFQTV